MIRFIYLLVSIPIIVILATFAYRNAGLVKLDLFVTEFNIPLAAVILLCVFIGIIIGFVVNILVYIQQKKRIQRLIKQQKTMSGLSDFLKSDTQ